MSSLDWAFGYGKKYRYWYRAKKLKKNLLGKEWIEQMRAAKGIILEIDIIVF